MVRGHSQVEVLRDAKETIIGADAERTDDEERNACLLASGENLTEFADEQLIVHRRRLSN
ncbi:MAG: hypothetical protein CVU38_00015 [Chloroflexi bacterium HGW-Chloroflexi-1]|nr:MAG: hypothetical protein CVU38_00015 [Chloroflexi bacterium HGW-Chloroflexi-1]